MSNKTKNGFLGAVYIVLFLLWTPVRFLLLANVVLHFFKMLFEWHKGPFSAIWPFALSFVILVVMTYVMAICKPDS